MNAIGLRLLTSAAVAAVLLQAGQGFAKESEEAARLDSRTRAVLISEINGLLIDQYIFLDVAREMKRHLESRLESGAYADIVDPHQLAALLRQDLYDVSQDHHFHLEFNPERARLLQAAQSRSPEAVAKAREALYEQGRRRNFGFKKVQHLAGNVGYLHLDEFADPRFAGNIAAAAMAWLATSDAVIIDLRDNSGGWPEMVQLICSYFIEGTEEGRTLLNSFERRYKKTTEQYWTLSWVPGETLYDKDLYILVSGATGSGAEEFTYNMKNLERATIVGETTRGAAHPVDAKVLLERFVLHLPTGRPVNPVTGTNWERSGIEPHVVVPADRALDAAHRMALEKILERVRDQNHELEIRWAFDGLQAKLDPLDVPAATLERYVGVYGERKVSLEDGALVYQRTGPRYRLIPLKSQLFAVEGLERFRVRFVLPERGRATELIGLHDDGTRDISHRTP